MSDSILLLGACGVARFGNSGNSVFGSKQHRGVGCGVWGKIVQRSNSTSEVGSFSHGKLSLCNMSEVRSQLLVKSGFAVL